MSRALLFEVVGVMRLYSPGYAVKEGGVNSRDVRPESNGARRRRFSVAPLRSPQDRRPAVLTPLDPEKLSVYEYL